jgi:GalNAc-alpha-(1->4)-GalNAc-alpha-(1->3)-diNAcBac-PP-undecaprenol alpha-1,4-N-acetyl-D-galactosaminyltransferase
MKSKGTVIVFVIPSLGPGGAERFVVNMANYYISKHRVIIVGLYKNRESYYHIDSGVEIQYCSQTYNPSSGFFSAILSNVKYIRTLYRICKSANASSVVSFTTSANVISIIVSRLLSLNVLISERANPYIYKPNRLWSVLRYFFYKYSNKLIVQTNFSKVYFKKYIAEESIKVFPNMVNPQFSNIRNKYNSSNRAIVTVGRLDDNKAQDILIKAFAKCRLPEWKLVIVGDGENRNKYLNLVEKLSLKEEVTFVGNSDSVDAYYNEAGMFVFTSKSEGFPNALLEALYFGLPTISSDCESGPRDLINDGVNGYLFSVGDVEMLAEKLTSLALDQTLRLRFSEAALKSTKMNEVQSIMPLWDNLII